VQKGLPLLNDGGSIILTGSVASVKGTPAFGVYAASKAAIRSFVLTWTTDLKDRHIRSNVVSPGPIRTPLTLRQSADVIARIVSTVPMGRMGEPDELPRRRCPWCQMIRVLSGILNCSLMGAECKSNREPRF
jgi:NAD(P)-dependent dehydrogenase (short-subunit alcohol dehydrogenase family)